MRFQFNEGLDKTGNAVIQKWYQDLEGFAIAFLFRSPGVVTRGKTIIAKAYKPGAKERFLWAGLVQGAPDAVVEVDEESYLAMNPTDQKAHLDHALAALEVVELKKGGLRLRLRGPDVQEFSAVLARRGAYNPDLAEFIAQAKQASLFAA